MKIKERFYTVASRTCQVPACCLRKKCVFWCFKKYKVLVKVLVFKKNQRCLWNQKKVSLNNKLGKKWPFLDNVFPYDFFFYYNSVWFCVVIFNFGLYNNGSYMKKASECLKIVPCRGFSDTAMKGMYKGDPTSLHSVRILQWTRSM